MGSCAMRGLLHDPLISNALRNHRGTRERCGGMVSESNWTAAGTPRVLLGRRRFNPASGRSEPGLGSDPPGLDRLHERLVVALVLLCVGPGELEDRAVELVAR